MRVFCFVFIIYIVLLSLAPCDEMIENARALNDEVSAQKTLHENTHHDENGDDCSPFCICSCCHFSASYQFENFSITEKITVSAVFETEIIYENPDARDYKTSVFQPPKFDSIG